MKRLFTHLRLLPDALLKQGATGGAGAAVVECPTCGTLARSVDCKANVASRAGGASASSSGSAVPGSSLSAARHPRQQPCGASSQAATQQQPQQRYQRVATAAGGAWREAPQAGAAGRRQSFAQTLMISGFSAGVGLAITTAVINQGLVDNLTYAVWEEAAQLHACRTNSQPPPLLSPYFIADAAAKVAPAVVNITVQDPRQSLDDAVNGSGFIISSSGIIVTNTHIVADAVSVGGAAGNAVVCTLQDGRSFQAELVNFDWQSDVAVLRIHAAAPLPVAKLGESAALRVGEWVIALGSPLHLSNSVSAGIVSAVERKGAELGLDGSATDYIQTDAATATGSSGGPLVNVQGEVIGISNLKAIAGDGVSFAIPIDTAKDVIAQLLLPNGRVARPYIGCKTLELNSSLAAELKASSSSFPDVAAGIYVPYVQPGGPADRAGLVSGDVITGISGQPLSSKEFQRALAQNVGKPLPVSVVRSDGSSATLRITATDAMPSLPSSMP